MLKMCRRFGGVPRSLCPGGRAPRQGENWATIQFRFRPSVIGRGHARLFKYSLDSNICSTQVFARRSRRFGSRAGEPIVCRIERPRAPPGVGARSVDRPWRRTPRTSEARTLKKDADRVHAVRCEAIQVVDKLPRLFVRDQGIGAAQSHDLERPPVEQQSGSIWMDAEN